MAGDLRVTTIHLKAAPGVATVAGLCAIAAAIFLTNKRSEDAVVYSVIEAAPAESTRTPLGCDIVTGEHRIVDERGAATSWVPTQYSFCQLPAEWREAVRHARVGEVTQYLVPGRLVPTSIAQLLRVRPNRDLDITFRTLAIDDPPPGLSFPGDIAPPPDATTLPTGVRFVARSKNDAPALHEGSAIAVRYSFWQTDGTLVGTSYFSATPTVLSVGQTGGYVREILLSLTGAGDEVTAWLPPEIAESSTPILLRAKVEKVLR